MARSRAERRLDELVDTAGRVFSRLGYRQAQMADVAREMGVAAGTLYNYVENKEALFDLCVQRAFLLDPPPEPSSLPVPAPAPEAVVEHVRERLSRLGGMPRLAEALRREAPEDAGAELEGLVRELYGFLARHGPGIRLLERVAAERPELAALYFGKARAGLIERWARYLGRRIASGRLRPVPDVETGARFLIEAISWFAWHRHGDPAPHDYDDDVACQTAVTFAVRTLAVEAAS